MVSAASSFHYWNRFIGKSDARWMVDVCPRTWSNFIYFPLFFTFWTVLPCCCFLIEKIWKICLTCDEEYDETNFFFLVSFFFSVSMKRNPFFSLLIGLLFNWENLGNFCHLTGNSFENLISRRKVIFLFRSVDWAVFLKL